MHVLSETGQARAAAQSKEAVFRQELSPRREVLHMQDNPSRQSQSHDNVYVHVTASGRDPSRKHDPRSIPQPRRNSKSPDEAAERGLLLGLVIGSGVGIGMAVGWALSQTLTRDRRASKHKHRRSFFMGFGG